MKRKFQIFCCLFILFTIYATGQNTGEIALIPRPGSVSLSNGTFQLNRVFRIYDASLSGKNYGKFLNSAGLSTMNYKCINSSAGESEITIKKAKSKDTDESYNLTVSPKGIGIDASGHAGVLYAIETLKQILVQTWNGKEFKIPCMTIRDEPAFRYRGFLLDASRHFQPVATVKHVLDYMLSMKLNAFHWHLTDNEGWRVQSLKHPELNSVGSFINDSNQVETNGFYSLEDIKDILAYARERNIEVIPEIEIPGHSGAILRAFPQLRCPNMTGSTAYCAGNPASYKMIKDVFTEWIDIFKPRYIHIGGDEREKDLWNRCELCKAKMKEVGVTNENDLQNKMLQEISAFVHSKGVKTIAWAENLEGGIANGQIIQSWRLKDEAYKSIKLGHAVIISDNQECYLDYPENQHDAIGKPDWMVILPLEKVYNFDPVPQGLSKEEEKLVMGSECPLWTELITINKIYPQIKDRIEAHAEKCWTKREQKNFDDFSRRLNILHEYFKIQFYGEESELYHVNQMP